MPLHDDEARPASPAVAGQCHVEPCEVFARYHLQRTRRVCGIPASPLWPEARQADLAARQRRNPTRVGETVNVRGEGMAECARSGSRQSLDTAKLSAATGSGYRR